MGIYLNPGSEKFKQAIRSQIYVDKTGLIAYTNSVLRSLQRFLCVSRPRRFGKSIAADMLAAYYGRGEDTRALFKGYEIAGAPSFDEHAGKYDVIALNMTDFLIRAGSINAMFALIEKDVVGELAESYGDAGLAGADLVTALSRTFAHTRRGIVVLIDEWDCVFRERKEDVEGQKAYLDFLKLILKDKPYVALAYMTGILPIKKYGKHSALNMFNEFSMADQDALARFTGFTQDEVDELCGRYNMDKAKTAAWYNGYILEDRTERYAVYSPRSVVNSMLSGKHKGYWTVTETYEALREYIVMDFDGLRDTVTKLMAGEREYVNTERFPNDMSTFEKADDVLTLLVHLGYLGYDSETREAFMPNHEIQSEFVTAMEDGGWPGVIKAIGASKSILKSIWEGDEAAVAAGIEAAHFETSQITYNSEAALSYTVSLALYAARDYYTVIRELPTGKGFADLAFVPRPHHPDKPALLAELKWDKDARTAIKQIREKNYPESLKDYVGNLQLIGVSYEKATKKHVCVIEHA
jgi:hypothetical protein